MSEPHIEPEVPFVPTSVDDGVIVINPEGLDEAALRQVMVPFPNSSRICGLQAAAENVDDDPEFDELAKTMIRAAFGG